MKHMLGDITLRIKPTASAGGHGAGGSNWAIFDSAFAAESAWGQVVNASTVGEERVLAAHDITALLDSSAKNQPGYDSTYFDAVPVKVTRSWEATADNSGIIMRFNITNTHGKDLTIGR